RQALIRTYLILCTVGAQVYQLTTWDESEGKGVDDYLVNRIRTNGQHNPTEIMTSLLAAARPFVETLNPTPADLASVVSELLNVHVPDILRKQLEGPLAKRLGVPVESLRAVKPKTNGKPELAFAAEYEPWPDPDDPEDLLNEIMIRIKTEVLIDHHQLWAC